MYPFQNLNSLTFILKSFLFFGRDQAPHRGKKGKQNGVDMAKKIIIIKIAEG